MKEWKNWIVCLLLIGLTAFLWSCVAVREEGVSSITPVTSEEAVRAEKAAGVAVGKAENVYKLDIKALDTVDCARCHYSVFTDIKDNGGKHQLECRKCHERFHTYKPGTPWEDVVPKCTTCHGEIHGKDFLDCMACHTDAHMPISTMINIEALSKDCAGCHVDQATEVVKFPSAHTDTACSECHHSSHGYIPACTECHPEPHTPYQNNTVCEGCHPVHSPLQIAYGEEIDNGLCAGCHGEITKTLLESPKKHSTVKCVDCHAQKHRFIPKCQKCHSAPHSESLLQKFGSCADCHGDPHALALMEK
ncbi:MAG: hypothetical protein JW786_03270 [Desulfobacterales bacterium]|nr:hypothetical protein [Desulfobacterales bacterium]